LPAVEPAPDNAPVAIPDYRMAFARLLHEELDLAGFFGAADQVLARHVEFDASCWLSLDPETLLPTGHYSRVYRVPDMLRLVSNEYMEADYNKFADLARRPRPVATLSRSTEGDLSRSSRHVGFLTEQGFGAGDELRAVFRDGDVPWGALAIHRRSGVFDDHEANLIADATGILAHGIRRALVRSGAAAGQGRAEVGMVLLRPDDTIEAASPAARRWLGDLFDTTAGPGTTPLTIVSVAQQARLIGAGASDDVATARLRSRSGTWLRLDGSLLDDDERVAVMISTGAESGLADLIARAHGLSSREREVTALTMQGHSTREMADALGVSPYTVQDHLKSIFEKVGVRSRRELAAQLFVLDVAPRIAAGEDGVASVASAP
jgi:DNA-binding CsgD family transcriptional regulator